MNYIISSVILPGLRPVCPECFSRGYVGPLLLGRKEVYSFGVSEPQAQLDWDIDAARALIAARPPHRTAARPGLVEELAYRANAIHTRTPHAHSCGKSC